MIDTGKLELVSLDGLKTMGGPGLPGFGLTDAECQCERRFDPIRDGMGFFLAKLRKPDVALSC
jgi:16S rRNA C967 or C1407 C5-methylase (RsmB/RsmF family)